MATKTFIEAIRETMVEEMRRDRNVVVFCEDGRFWTMPTTGFVDEFGPARLPAGRGMDDRGREHETDLSAESDKAPPHPWLSSTHGDP